jgi:hypothetical protein
MESWLDIYVPHCQLCRVPAGPAAGGPPLMPQHPAAAGSAAACGNVSSSGGGSATAGDIESLLAHTLQCRHDVSIQQYS